MPKLKTETNTRKMALRVETAVVRGLQLPSGHHHMTVAFEHGQWWAICKDCGGQWSVVDQDGADNRGVRVRADSAEGVCGRA